MITRRAALALPVLGLAALSGCGESQTTGEGEARERLARRWYGLYSHRTLELWRVPAPPPASWGVFVKLNSDIGDGRLTQHLEQGLTPMVTLEPWLWEMGRGDAENAGFTLERLLEGRHDEALNRIAKSLSELGRPVFIRFAHEANGHWYPWGVGNNGNTPGQYRAAWRHVRDLFASTTNAKWVWSVNITQWLREPQPLAPMYPGADLVDFLACTGYPRYGASPSQTFGPTLDELSTLGDQDVIITETGAPQGDGQISWIRDLGNFLAETPRIRGLLWFDVGPPAASADYRLDQEASQRAFAEAMAAGGMG